MYYEIPWSQVDPFNDGFRRFELTVKTNPVNGGGGAVFAALWVRYTGSSETYIEGESSVPGNIHKCSLEMESKNPITLGFAYRISNTPSYFGCRNTYWYDK